MLRTGYIILTQVARADSGDNQIMSHVPPMVYSGQAGGPAYLLAWIRLPGGGWAAHIAWILVEGEAWMVRSGARRLICLVRFR